MGTEQGVVIGAAIVVLLLLCWRPIVIAMAICFVGVLLVGIVQVVQWFEALS